METAIKYHLNVGRMGISLINEEWESHWLMETAIIYHLNVGRMGISLINGNCHNISFKCKKNGNLTVNIPCDIYCMFTGV